MPSKPAGLRCWLGSGPATSDLNVNGRRVWNAASDWADELVCGGFDDWRLPTLNPADTPCSSICIPGAGFLVAYSGTGCTGGELGELPVTGLGNKAGAAVLNQVGDTAGQTANLALFSTVQSKVCWPGTE